MVYCYIHKTYHNGLKAKLACMVSVSRGLPLENAVDRIKNVPDEKLPGLIQTVDRAWEDYSIAKSDSEDILKFEALRKNTSRSYDDSIKMTKIHTKKEVGRAFGMINKVVK